MRNQKKLITGQRGFFPPTDGTKTFWGGSHTFGGKYRGFFFPILSRLYPFGGNHFPPSEKKGRGAHLNPVKPPPTPPPTSPYHIPGWGIISSQLSPNSPTSPKRRPPRKKKILRDAAPQKEGARNNTCQGGSQFGEGKDLLHQIPFVENA